MEHDSELEAARFFMKLERLLNELEDEKELVSHNLHMPHESQFSSDSGKNTDGENNVKVIKTSDKGCKNDENIYSNDYI